MTTSDESPFEHTALYGPVEPPSAAFASEARRRLDNLVRPPGAGRLVDAACWLAATQRQIPPRQLIDVRLVLFAGERPIAKADSPEHKSAAAQVRAALNGGLAVNSLAAAHGVRIRVLDIDVDDDFRDVPAETRSRLTTFKLRSDVTPVRNGDALDPRTLENAIAAGITAALEETSAGAQLLLASCLDPGTGVTAADLIRSALRLAGESSGVAIDPRDVLTASGSAAFAATTSFMLTAARVGVPVLLGGAESAVAALLADLAAPGAGKWFVAGLSSPTPGHAEILKRLHIEPLTKQVTDAAEPNPLTAVPLLRSAAAMLIQTATTEDLDI